MNGLLSLLYVRAEFQIFLEQGGGLWKMVLDPQLEIPLLTPVKLSVFRKSKWRKEGAGGGSGIPRKKCRKKNFTTQESFCMFVYLIDKEDLYET